MPRRHRRVRRLHLAAHHRPRWPTARTPSRSAPPTQPATPARPRAAPSPSTRPRRRRRSTGPSGLTGDADADVRVLGRARRELRVPRRHAPPSLPARRRYTIGPLDDGPHTFEVRATDQAGNEGPAASRTVTVDTTAPETTITGPSGLTRDSTPTFEFSSEAGRELRVPGRRGSLRRLHFAAHDRGPRRRIAHVRGPRHRRRRQHRHRRQPHRHDRHDRAADDDDHRAERADRRRDADVRVLVRAGRDLRVPRRRGRSPPAPRRTPSARSPTARTPSRSAPPTPPATRVDAASRTVTVDTTPPQTTIDRARAA